EGRGEARVLLQMDDAGAVGADDSETVLRDERAQRRVARLAGVAGLGEAAGQDDEMTVAALRRLAHRVEDEVGPDDDDRDIGRMIELVERPLHGMAEHLAALGIDRDHRAGEPGDAQILQHRAARRGRPLAGADHGDAPGREERREVARHVSRGYSERAAPPTPALPLKGGGGRNAGALFSPPPLRGREGRGVCRSTGTWSEALSQPRAARCTSAAASAGWSGAVTQMWSRRRPRSDSDQSCAR